VDKTFNQSSIFLKTCNNLGRARINEIMDEGWNQVDFIEVVFREWSKINQDALDREYTIQEGIPRKENDLDKFSLWLVDNIYLQVYCKSRDGQIVKELCIKSFGYEEGQTLS